MADSKFSEPNIQIRIPLKYRFPISPIQAKKTLAICQKYLNQQNVFDLSVIYTNNREIQAINQKYRDINHPTDVLSFSLDTIDPETGRKNLGDIFISIPKAQSQARQMKHSLKAELAILLIHGYLHLNGFDHDTEQNKKKMWALQDQIFSAFMSSKVK